MRSIKSFFTAIHAVDEKARVFIPAKFFQASLTFIDKIRAKLKSGNLIKFVIDALDEKARVFVASKT